MPHKVKEPIHRFPVGTMVRFRKNIRANMFTPLRTGWTRHEPETEPDRIVLHKGLCARVINVNRKVPMSNPPYNKDNNLVQINTSPTRWDANDDSNGIGAMWVKPEWLEVDPQDDTRIEIVVKMKYRKPKHKYDWAYSLYGYYKSPITHDYRFILCEAGDDAKEAKIVFDAWHKSYQLSLNMDDETTEAFNQYMNELALEKLKSV